MLPGTGASVAEVLLQLRVRKDAAPHYAAERAARDKEFETRMRQNMTSYFASAAWRVIGEEPDYDGMEWTGQAWRKAKL